MRSVPLIVLLTDFGSVDPYAGILKGVINQIAPGVPIVDLTHEVPPGNILRAAMQLWQSRQYFPQETVFLCVVDPGVGSTRRGILLRTKFQTFIGPDNGLFTFVMDSDAQVWELTNKEYMLPNPSATFHGRDMFAPVAAYTARGIAAEGFGEKIFEPVLLPSPALEITPDNSIAGEILYADRFGNLITSLGRFIEQLPGYFNFQPWVPLLSWKAALLGFSQDNTFLCLSSGEKLRWVRTYSNLKPGECGFLVGSSGLIEVVTNGARADQILKLPEREPIILITSGK